MMRFGSTRFEPTPQEPELAGAAPSGQGMAGARGVPAPARILHVISHIGTGGVEQCCLTLARSLPPGAYEHMVICQTAGQALPALLQAEAWQVETIGLLRHRADLGWYRRALRLAQRFRPDLIHGAVFEGVLLANVLGVALGSVPVISEETSDPRHYRRRRATLALRALTWRSAKVIGVSPAVGTYLRQDVGVPPRKLQVIDNGVLPAPVVEAPLRLSLRQGLGIAPEDLVIGSVGRLLDSHKRFSDLIAAFALLPRDGPQRLRLLLVGDGPDRLALEGVVAQHGLQGQVILAGYRADVRQLYAVMDIFALASAHEAFGLVLVEAMLAHVPVVASAVGGIAHVLDHGKAGCLVPARQPAALAQAITALLAAPDTARGLAAAGQRHAARAFGASRYGAEFHALYQALLPPARRWPE